MKVKYIFKNYLYDPYVRFGKNLTGSNCYFFHGTRIENLNKIKNKGLCVTPGRPTFTLIPQIAFIYCGKSESYLRNLFIQGDIAQLNKEKQILLESGVITKAESEMHVEDINSWVDKAHLYYAKNSDICNEGVIIVIELSRKEVFEPYKSNYIFYNNRKVFYGSVGIWRSRQFVYNVKSTDYIDSQRLMFIKINKPVKDIVNDINGNIGIGILNKGMLEKFREIINKNLIIDPIVNRSDFIKSFIDQTIEGQLIRSVRSLFVAILFNKGWTNLYKRNKRIMDDPRHRMTHKKVEVLYNNLKTIEYLENSQREYLNKALEKIGKL